MTTVQVFLVVVMLFSNGTEYKVTHAMPAWETCMEAVTNSGLRTPNGAENGTMAVIYCAYGEPEGFR